MLLNDESTCICWTCVLTQLVRKFSSLILHFDFFKLNVVNVARSKYDFVNLFWPFDLWVMVLICECIVLSSEFRHEMRLLFFSTWNLDALVFIEMRDLIVVRNFVCMCVFSLALRSAKHFLGASIFLQYDYCGGTRKSYWFGHVETSCEWYGAVNFVNA